MDKSEGKQLRSRRLAQHEAELWEHVTRHVRPLRPGSAALKTAATISKPAKGSPAAALAQPAPAKPHVSTLKPLVQVEARLLRRLSRGQGHPEAKIDLHGMRQAEAHSALRNFIHRAHADGLRMVLVVTGKGAGETGNLHGDERGVLRRSLPHWLSASDLRSAVLGFEEAARRHGGEGAFYVQLRAANLRKTRHVQ
jgi:DNA-nicking Smr family endonuclease